jgi:ribosomal protein S18 acetylase RimI-like enzyme
MIEIARATEDDAEEIAEIQVAGWRWGYRGLLPDGYLSGLGADPERWQKAITTRGTRLWLARSSTEPVGFAATGPPRDAGHSPGVAELGALYLREDAAGKGVGRRLLEHAAGELRERGFAHVYLWVLASNQRARGFYAHCGWRTDGAARAEKREQVELHEVRYWLDLQPFA